MEASVGGDYSQLNSSLAIGRWPADCIRVFDRQRQQVNTAAGNRRRTQPNRIVEYRYSRQCRWKIPIQGSLRFNRCGMYSARHSLQLADGPD
jgi:hypothetical protein